MRVHIFAADTYACGHYRVVWPGLAVDRTESDFEVTIVPPGDKSSGLVLWRDEDGEVAKVTAPETDLVVLQRVGLKHVMDAIPHIRAQGIAVIVDVDDDLSYIDPANPAWVYMHPKPTLAMEPPERREQFIAEARKRLMQPEVFYRMYNEKRPRHSWKNVEESCRRATMTTVSTQALVRSYGRGNARVVHNYVPRAMLNVPHIDNTVIGWGGSTHSHPGDLRAMTGGIPQGASFMVVGDGTGADRDLGLSNEVSMTGAIDFDVWPSAITQIGIGVAPLLDTRFNRAKSWLKPLEYSAVGVPWVASPRPEYVSLQKLGAGFIADRPREWQRILRRLIEDEALRREQSEAARELARQMTIEEHAWRWAEVWRDAITLERTRRSHTLDTALASG